MEKTKKTVGIKVKRLNVFRKIILKFFKRKYAVLELKNYELELFADGKVWLWHKSGEGMEVNRTLLSEVFDNFFREYF